MKYLLSFITLFFAFSLSAQEVEETTQDLSVGTQNSYLVEIENADDNMAEDVWKDYIKGMDAKVKKNKKAKEFYTEKVRLNGVNNGNPVDLYMKIYERKGMVQVYVSADRGDAFIGSNDTPDDTEAMRQIVYNYGLEVNRKVTEKEIEEQEKLLKNLRKDLEKLEKKNGNYHNDIKKAEEKIREAEEKIEVNLKDQDMKREEVEAQVKIVEQVVTKYNNIGKN